MPSTTLVLPAATVEVTAAEGEAFCVGEGLTGGFLFAVDTDMAVIFGLDLGEASHGVNDEAGIEDDGNCVDGREGETNIRALVAVVLKTLLPTDHAVVAVLLDVDVDVVR